MPQTHQAHGQTKTIEQWALDPRCWVDRAELERRTNAGWPIDVALALPKALEEERVTAFGETKPLAEWLLDPRRTAPPGQVIFLIRGGSQLEHALEGDWRAHPLGSRRHREDRVVEAWGEKKPLCQWIKDKRCRVDYSVAYARLVRLHGWTPEKALSTPVVINAEIAERRKSR